MIRLGQLHINVTKFKNKKNIVACIIHHSQKWDNKERITDRKQIFLLIVLPILGKNELNNTSCCLVT